jgi:hypothetical protein
MITDETPWRDESAIQRIAFAKIDSAARAAGFTGEGDGEPVRPRTLGDVMLADSLFIDAGLGQMPTWLYDEAVSRCRRIVATSKRPAPVVEPGETEETIATKAVDVAKRLGLDGGIDEPHEWCDLSDDAQRVASRLLDEHLEAGRLSRDLARYARRLACSLAGSSSEERIAAAVLRLRMLPDALAGTDLEAEAAHAKWQSGEPARPRATGPAFNPGDLAGLADALRGGAIR